MKCDGDL